VYEELQWLLRAIRTKLKVMKVQQAQLQKADLLQLNLWDEFHRRLVQRLHQAVLAGVIKMVALDNILALYHFDKPIEIDTMSFADHYAINLAQMVTRVSDETKYRIAKKVLRWYRAGDQPIGKLIEDLQTDFSQKRAALIARTETTDLNSAVQYRIREVLGIHSWWWQTMRDDVVCTRPMKGRTAGRTKAVESYTGRYFPTKCPSRPRAAILVVGATRQHY